MDYVFYICYYLCIRLLRRIPRKDKVFPVPDLDLAIIFLWGLAIASLIE